LPTSPPTDSLFQTYSNEIPDYAPDKTGYNREIELEKLNFDYPIRTTQDRDKIKIFRGFRLCKGTQPDSERAFPAIMTGIIFTVLGAQQ
jgi:hypothetical protein